MTNRIKQGLRAMGMAAALMAGAVAPSWAGPITTFYDAPTGLSPLATNGTVILADDFVPEHTGWLHSAIWWGSRPPTDSHWVVAFYANSAGHPAGNPVLDTLARFEFDLPGESAFSFGTPEFIDGTNQEIWRFAVRLPEVLELLAGTEYWFSVTNLASGWSWAEASNAPTVGTQHYSAQGTDRTEPPTSAGCPDPDIGPGGAPLNCYGPWTDLQTNFAFQIVVPEPGSLPLVGLALLLLALHVARKSRDRLSSRAVPAGAICA